MAIVTENYEVNGVPFVRTYSNANRYVVGGIPVGQYIEANDPASFGRTYVEGDPIVEGIDPNEATAEDYENALTELGVAV